jgi:CrcB protein
VLIEQQSILLVILPSGEYTIIMEKFILISAGAVLGANARYWLGDWAAQKWGAGFPMGTLLINLTGSLLLGLFMTLATERFLVDPRWRILITVGFLGAYTTFSTYTFESLALLLKGQWLLGLANLFGSTILGVMCVGIGVYLGKIL